MQEKSKGILIFAYNTNTVDYIRIAELSAALARAATNLPVTLVTDCAAESAEFDQVIVHHNSFKNSRRGYLNLAEWKNGGRHCAYDLSPYDTTLLVDADYLMFDNSIAAVMDTVDDYAIFSSNRYLDQDNHVHKMSAVGLGFHWATGIVFRKTKKAKLLFELVGRIQRNYQYYYKLYNVTASNFRNDYAFAIADSAVNGYQFSAATQIPYALTTVSSQINAIEFNCGKLIVRLADQALYLPAMNLHIMDKEYLQSEQFCTLVERVIKERK